MKNNKLEPVKCFTIGNNYGYDVQLKINGITLAEKDISGLKIFSEDHPFKTQFENMPPFLKEETSFFTFVSNYFVRSSAIFYKLKYKYLCAHTQSLNILLNSCS